MGSRASVTKPHQRVFTTPNGQLVSSITSTPSGRSVKLETGPDQGSPYGLDNSAVHYSWHIQSLFNGAGWLPKRSNRPARHYVNMVTIQELQDGQASSTNSSTGSVPTEVINSEDEDYDLDLPPYPPGFSRFPVFPPRRGDLIFNVSTDEPVVDGEQTSRGSSASSAMLTAPDDARTRNANSHHITSPTLSTWSGISQSTKRQAPTWLSPWPT